MDFVEMCELPERIKWDSPIRRRNRKKNERGDKVGQR